MADRRDPETWAPLRDASIHLPDGRLLAFAEWGDPGGRPVFLFHGMPGSAVLPQSRRRRGGTRPRDHH